MKNKGAIIPIGMPDLTRLGNKAGSTERCVFILAHLMATGRPPQFGKPLLRDRLKSWLCEAGRRLQGAYKVLACGAYLHDED